MGALTPLSAPFDQAATLGRNFNDALLRLFDGTDFGRSLTVDPDDYDCWSLLVRGLRDCAQHVIRLEDFGTYWRHVRSTSGEYDIREDRLRFGRNGLWTEGSTNGLALRSTCSDETAPVPSVRLLRRLQHHPTSGRLWLARSRASKDISSAPEFANLSPEDWAEKQADYRLWLDIRLALAPGANADDIAPLIELRTNLELVIDGEVGIPDNPYTDGADTVLWIDIGGERRRVILDSPEDLPLPFKSASFWMAEHSYFAWGQLTAETLRELLDADAPFPCAADAFDARCGQISEKCIFAEPWIAAVETRLRSGQLETELLERTRALKTMLAAHRARLRSEFDADMAAAADRWEEAERIAASLCTSDQPPQPLTITATESPSS